MEERSKVLLKNTTILTIGEFSSKLLTYFLVPMYTFYLLPSEFGQVNLYLTVLSMLYIIVSLQSIESAFRFIQDCKDKEETISTITNSIAIAVIGIIIFSVIMVIIGIITPFRYNLLFIAFVATTVFANQFLHVIRGMNKTISYVTVSVISTVTTALCNFLFVAGLEMGAISLLIAPIIANVIVIAVICYKEKFLDFVKINSLNKEVIRSHLRFAIPLIPNSLSIWLLSSIGIFVILYFYDTNAVGLLVFALKFPMLLGTIGGIFHMAWQISAISQYDAADKNYFASEVFHKFALLQITSLILILPILKILIITMMGDLYIEAWVYVPIFMIGILVKNFAQFFNAGFYSAKKTKQIFYSSLIAVIVYFLISIILAKPLFLFGIGIAYSLSEIVRLIFIVNRVSPFMRVSIYYLKLTPISITLFMYVLLYYSVDIEAQLILFIIGIPLAIVFNKELFNKLLMNLKSINKIRSQR
jgi:O-antigen/teichoic acid export membrane protein